MDSKAVWPGWETVRLIGRGSFGAVYEIERDILGEKEKAALKVITIPQSNSDINEMFSDGYDEESITSTFKEHLKSIIAEYSLMRKLNGSSNVVNCDDVRYVQHDDGFGWDSERIDDQYVSHRVVVDGSDCFFVFDNRGDSCEQANFDICDYNARVMYVYISCGGLINLCFFDEYDMYQGDIEFRDNGFGGFFDAEGNRQNEWNN